MSTREILVDDVLSGANTILGTEIDITQYGTRFMIVGTGLLDGTTNAIDSGDTGNKQALSVVDPATGAILDIELITDRAVIFEAYGDILQVRVLGATATAYTYSIFAAPKFVA